jgi:thymidylate synthase ThyX
VQRDNESDVAYALRLRRQATDACRAVLPAATLTNVGVTANARTLEHAISKLMSSTLTEERDIGVELREQGRSITPTLVKYADHNSYLAETRRIAPGAPQQPERDAHWSVRLLEFDGDAPRKLCAALLFRQGGSYGDALASAKNIPVANCLAIISEAVRDIGPHDPPPREFELVDFTFEFVFDYGALREFRRHRMQTYLSQPLTVVNGHETPALFVASGMSGVFETAIAEADDLFRTLADENPALAQYAVTHAHRQRVLSKMNLRECYHLFKLRSSRQAHAAIRQPVLEAMRLAVEAQPELFRYLPLRNAPAWWPFTRE